MKKKRIGILTGGGDCPGLNAAIKRVVYVAACHDAHDQQKNPIEVIAIKEGWEGLLMLDPKKGIKDGRYVQLLTQPVVRKEYGRWWRSRTAPLLQCLSLP